MTRIQGVAPQFLAAPTVNAQRQTTNVRQEQVVSPRFGFSSFSSAEASLYVPPPVPSPTSRLVDSAIRSLFTLANKLTPGQCPDPTQQSARPAILKPTDLQVKNHSFINYYA
jgi:hypothetical protein